MPTPRSGGAWGTYAGRIYVAGAVIGNQFHLVTGMVSSGAATSGDTDIHLHTNAHDVIELPGQPVAAR